MRRISEVIAEAFEDYENDVEHELMKLNGQLTFLEKEREYLKKLASEKRVVEVMDYLINGFK